MGKEELVALISEFITIYNKTYIYFDNIRNDYYIYAYIDTDRNDVFYIGKGTDVRIKKLYHHNSRCKQYAQSHNYEAVILKNNLSEEDAYELEQYLVNTLVYTYDYGIDVKKYENPLSIHHLYIQQFGGAGNPKKAAYA